MNSEIAERSIFIGIDQTGAVDHRGKPKPLPAAIIYRSSSNAWSLECQFLPSLSEFHLQHAIAPLGLSYVRDNVVIAIDCVLGLPQAFSATYPSLRSVIALTHKINAYGKGPGKLFFSQLLNAQTHLKDLPRRQVELLTHSNSVFTNKPFQKNIQTGTFRMWKDLAHDPSWFSLLFLEKRVASRVDIVEGYPSLSWNKVFACLTRQPLQFPALLTSYFPEIYVAPTVLKKIVQKHDFADAAVLASHLFKLYVRENGSISYQPNYEGHILGASALVSSRVDAKC